MDLSYVLALLTGEVRDNMASLADERSIASKAPVLRQLSGQFQALALCKLLVDADTTAFRVNLIRSAQARRYHLRKAREEQVAERYQGLSKTESVFDALVAGAPELAHEIVSLSTTEWHMGWEYEDDFCYFFFVHRLITQSGFLASDDARSLLARFEASLEGQRSTRLALCRALHARDAVVLREALESFLDARKRELDVRRDRITEYSAQAIFWPKSFVSVEALAWLVLARAGGIPLDDEFLYCPRAARGFETPPPAVEDFFESLDAALRGLPP